MAAQKTAAQARRVAALKRKGEVMTMASATNFQVSNYITLH